VCRHRGRSTMDAHAGREPKLTARRIWLCVKGRNGIGPATAATLFAFAAAKDAPVEMGETDGERAKRRRWKSPNLELFKNRVD
jgi:hypothetical protein